MHYRNPRLRVVKANVAALTTAALVAACGGSGDSSNNFVSNGSDNNQPTKKKSATWQDEYTPIKARDHIFRNQTSVAGRGIVTGGDYVAVASTTKHASDSFGTVTIYPKKGGTPVWSHLTYSDITGMAPLPGGGFVVAGHHDTNWFVTLYRRKNGQWQVSDEKLIAPCKDACNVAGGTSTDLVALATSKNGNIYLLGYGGASLTEDTILKAVETDNGQVTAVNTIYYAADTSPNGMAMDILVKSKGQKDYVYFVNADGFPNQDNDVFAFIYQQGGTSRQLWETVTGEHSAYLRFGPEGNIYVFDEDGETVQKLDRETGKSLWQYTYKPVDDFADAYIGKQGHIFVAAASKTEDSLGDRNDYAVIYAIKPTTNCINGNKQCPMLMWRNLYDDEPLIDLRGKITKILGLGVKLKGSKWYNHPLALSGHGDELYLVTNTSIVTTLLLPSINVAQVLTIDQSGRHAGRITHTNGVLHLRMDAVSFSDQKPGYLYAVGGNSAPPETNAEKAQKLVTGRYAAPECPTGLRGLLCKLNLGLLN